MAGYLSGVGDVPVNLVDRVEVYRGVVPVRFGADALRGAVNLVTDQNVRGTHASASYEVGSFGTYRVTIAGQHLHRPTGFFARVSAFSDYAKNDYPIDVMVPDDRGRLSPARAYRFHDSYRANGAVAEVGFVNRPWARRLLLHAFVNGYEKELQHNTVMTVPYGDVHYGGTTAGATLRYEQPLGRGVSLDSLAGYTYSNTRFVDVGKEVYDWFGHVVRARAQPGEISGEPTDQSMWQHRVFARLNLGFRPAPEHGLHLSVAPIFATRTGADALEQPGSRDPLTAERRLFSMVSGSSTRPISSTTGSRTSSLPRTTSSSRARRSSCPARSSPGRIAPPTTSASVTASAIDSRPGSTPRHPTSTRPDCPARTSCSATAYSC